MGYTSLKSIDWTTTRSYSETAAAALTAEAFYKASELNPRLDPSKFDLRESRDSVENPLSTPIMVFSDVTGSMGSTAHYMAKQGFTTLVEEILARLPVTDPHILLGAVGDATVKDQAPLQASQFETSTVLLEQLSDLWVEKGGGSNNFESYNLPWHLAAFHTSCDSFEKRGVKGFLFTVGDERCPPDLTAENLHKVYKRGQEPLRTNAQLLEELFKKYHVFHICLTSVGAGHYDYREVRRTWETTLGGNALFLSDPNVTAEVMISAMQLVRGDSRDEVIDSWPKASRVAIRDALKSFTPSELYSKPATPVAEPEPEQGLLRF